jgi:uncharacterized protein
VNVLTLDQAEVVDVSNASRYELRCDGRLVGLAAYHRRDGRLAVTHTEVDPSCEGRGFGSRLVQGVLDDAREQGLEVVPLCPFVSYYVTKHPEYADLVAPAYRRG